METANHSFDEKFRLLQNYIKGSYSVESYSDMFSSLKHNHEKVGMAYYFLAEAQLLPGKMKVHPKSSKESSLFREKGNKEFFQRKDLLAIQTYSVSAAFAPNSSEELALAYANRSAVTFSLKEYNPCIEDIDRAINGKYPEQLRYKLLERKGKCLQFLGLSSAAKDVFQLALNVLPSSNLNGEKIESITLSLTKQINSCSMKNTFLEGGNKCLPFIQNKSPSILSASSLVQVEYSEVLGRHLVASADIEPGEILVIEAPFSSVLLPNFYNSHCFHCKKRCHSLIPCPHCVVAMYCSEQCCTDSWDESHRIECSLLPLLLALDFTKIELIATRTLLMATKQYESFQGLLEIVEEISSNTDPKTVGFDNKGHYNSEDYTTVHHLVENMELRSNADVFRRATAAAYILQLLDKNTDCFSSLVGFEEPEEFLEKPLYQKNKLLDSKRFLIGGLLLKFLMSTPSNAHEISEMFIRKSKGEMDCESVEIGGALYPVLSLINHSCDPNVVRHSHNGDLNVLSAIQFIAAGDQIFDNYGYHHAMHDLDTRQSKLWSQYHFKCQCRACNENWPVYSELPNKTPVYLNFSLKDEVEKSSDIFQGVLADVKSGNMKGKLGFLYAHLALLHRTIQRPWKEYSECQEAIKQCLSFQANHYIAP